MPVLHISFPQSFLLTSTSLSSLVSHSKGMQVPFPMFNIWLLFLACYTSLCITFSYLLLCEENMYWGVFLLRGVLVMGLGHVPCALYLLHLWVTLQISTWFCCYFWGCACLFCWWLCTQELCTSDGNITQGWLNDCLSECLLKQIRVMTIWGISDLVYKPWKWLRNKYKVARR